MRSRIDRSGWLLAAALLGACGGGSDDEGLRALKSTSPVTTATPADATQLRKAAAPIAGDLVVNGSFEQGEAGWTGSSSAGYALIGGFDQPPAPANTGTRFAWMGGANKLKDTLMQTITVPDGPGRVYLEFWYQVQTEERVEVPYDTLEVRASIGGFESSIMATLTNVHYTGGWTRAGPLDLTYYRGKTFQLQFQAITDSEWPTSFLIDDVSVYRLPSVGSTPETGMWWNPAQPGRGFFIDQQGGKLLLGAYAFTTSGQATWFSGLLQNPQPDLYSVYFGAVQRYSGGQSLGGG